MKEFFGNLWDGFHMISARSIKGMSFRFKAANITEFNIEKLGRIFGIPLSLHL